MGANSGSNGEPNLELLGKVNAYSEVASRRLQNQIESKRSLDNKIIGTLTVATAVMAFAATILSGEHSARWLILPPLFLGAIAYACVAYFAYHGYKKADIFHGPDGEDVAKEIGQHTNAGLREGIADRYAGDYVLNLDVMGEKVEAFSRSLKALMVEMAFLLIASGLALASHG